MIPANKILETLALQRFYIFKAKKMYRSKDDDDDEDKPYIVMERFPEKSIWCFTGYVYEKDILHRMIPKWKYTKKMLEQIDYLVDGPFVMEKKNISLKFRGSSNQRIIDVKKTLETGEVVLWEEQ